MSKSIEIKNLQAQGEVKALNQFLELMSTEPDRAFYGFKYGFCKAFL